MQHHGKHEVEGYFCSYALQQKSWAQQLGTCTETLASLTSSKKQELEPLWLALCEQKCLGERQCN